MQWYTKVNQVGRNNRNWKYLSNNNPAGLYPFWKASRKRKWKCPKSNDKSAIPIDERVIFVKEAKKWFCFFYFWSQIISEVPHSKYQVFASQQKVDIISLKMLTSTSISIQWSTVMLTLSLTLRGIYSFNIDSAHPIILSSGRGGHFGQSIQLVTNIISIRTSTISISTSINIISISISTNIIIISISTN